MYVLTILLLTTYAAAGQQKQNNTLLRVHDGVEDITGKYPYVVALRGNYPSLERACTGSFIKDTWVLTAAHCFNPSVTYVQYGNLSKLLPLTEMKSAVLKMISHPGYSGSNIPPNGMYTDIGLIMVQRAISMSKYARISAVDYRTLLGQPVVYAGVGMTFLPKRETRNKKQIFMQDLFRPLQTGEGVVTSCGDTFRNNLICARPKCSNSNQMILPGDSGGPLFFENKIVGVSFAILVQTFGQAFTPVSPHLSWIHSVVTSDHH